jgi:hypothetical protein
MHGRVIIYSCFIARRVAQLASAAGYVQPLLTTPVEVGVLHMIQYACFEITYNGWRFGCVVSTRWEAQGKPGFLEFLKRFNFHLTWTRTLASSHGEMLASSLLLFRLVFRKGHAYL